MPEVEPRFKTNRGLCGCGCELDGVYRAKAWKNGVRCVRTCCCRQCIGARNRKGGLKKQRLARRALGIPSQKFSDANEETWLGCLRVEVKSGAFAGPIATRYIAAWGQSEAARPIGDNRPFVLVAMPKDTSDGYVVIRLSDLHQVAAELVEMWGAA